MKYKGGFGARAGSGREIGSVLLIRRERKLKADLPVPVPLCPLVYLRPSTDEDSEAFLIPRNDGCSRRAPGGLIPVGHALFGEVRSRADETAEDVLVTPTCRYKAGRRSFTHFIYSRTRFN